MPWDQDIWNARYRHPGEKTPEDTMARVATHLAHGIWDTRFKDFMSIMERKEFIPGGRILANSGRPGGMLLNCFNVPIHDSRHDIFNSLSEGIEVLAHGGGVGFNFSNLRAAGSPLKSTGGTSQGPIPFIDLFDQAFCLISRSYQHRQAAAIAVIHHKHKDVAEFVRAKRNNGNGGKRWTSMNVSVDIGADFGDHQDDELLLKEMADSIWECGDPGLVFLDKAQEDNNLDPRYVPITGVNPCGEVPLPDYGACCLGSINLSEFVNGGAFDHVRLRFVTEVAVDMLSSALFRTEYPGEKFRLTAHKYRRIGLGVTGLAHALIKARLQYDSVEARSWVGDVMHTMAEAAYMRSSVLFTETGEAMEHFRKDGFMPKAISPRFLFNSGLLAVAPTGSTSMLLRTSPGIEPIFAVDTERTDRGVVRAIKDPLWGQYPEHLFRTSIEVSPEDHLRMLEAVQYKIDGSVSKTINLPESITKEEVRKFLVLAINSNAKGMTMYRDKSLGVQIVDLDQKIAEGTFYAIATPSGTIHVPVGRDARGNIKQVYILLDKPGGEEFALASALGRVLSIALQEGTPIERLVDTLTGIGAGQVKWTTIRGKKTPILSAPDAVAKVLADAIRQKTSTAPVDTDSCPDCRLPLTRAEGCVACGCGSYCEVTK